MDACSEIIRCGAILHEAYQSFKECARPTQNQVMKSEESSNSSADILIDESNLSISVRTKLFATRRFFLKFWLMFSIYSYAEKFTDRTIGRLPFYSLFKLILTTALALPNESVRDSLYNHLRPYLESCDASFEFHSSRFLCRSSYFLHRYLLGGLACLLHQSLCYLNEKQLEKVTEHTQGLAHIVKMESIQRLQSSVEQLPIETVSFSSNQAIVEVEEIASSTTSNNKQQYFSLPAPLTSSTSSNEYTYATDEPEEEEEEENALTLVSSHQTRPQPISGARLSTLPVRVLGPTTAPFCDITAAPSPSGLHMSVDENVDPNQTAQQWTSPKVSFATPHSSPSRRMNQNTSSIQNSPRTPSSLSQRLQVLEEKSNDMSLLRERTKTPQKTVPSLTGEQLTLSLKKKRQTFGV